MLADRDFNDDKKDAGEIGAGHTVTALYEVVLARRRGAGASPRSTRCKYQGDARADGRGAERRAADASRSATSARTRTRASCCSRAVVDARRALEQSSSDFRFAAAVAGFGMLLRGSDKGADVSFRSSASSRARPSAPTSTAIAGSC